MWDKTGQGLLLALVLVGGAWLLFAVSPTSFEQLNSALPTASAILALGLACVGAVTGTIAVVEGKNLSEAAPPSLLVLGGGLLFLASRLA